MIYSQRDWSSHTQPSCERGGKVEVKVHEAKAGKSNEEREIEKEMKTDVREGFNDRHINQRRWEIVCHSCQKLQSCLRTDL